MNEQDKTAFDEWYLRNCNKPVYPTDIWKGALEYRDKQNRIDELEHEIRLVRARNERLEKELHDARGSALNEAVDRFISGIEGQPAQEPVACLVGMKGGAFDTPKTKRAYTYKEQPDNIVAMKLGMACREANLNPGGDSIDLGLSLLKWLQDKGFGVFDLGAEYTAPPAAAINEQMLEALEDLVKRIKDWEESVAAIMGEPVNHSMNTSKAEAAIAAAEKLKGGV